MPGDGPCKINNGNVVGLSLDTRTVQGLSTVPIFVSMAASSPFLVYYLALPLAMGAMLRRQVVMTGSNLCL